MRYNVSAFRSGVLLGLAIAFSLAAGAMYMQGCASTPQQQQANLDTKAIASEVATAIRSDPNLDSNTKANAELVATAVSKAIDAQGKVTVDSVANAVLQSGAVPPQYSTYGVLALLAARMVQAQIEARRKPTPTT